jgi:hypothetical protein
MPVKDSLQTATEAVRAICKAGLPLTVFNDFSTAENTAALQQLAGELHFTLVNLQELTGHPSPNYLLVLQIAQQQALDDGAHLVIVESDVIVRGDTVMRLAQAADTPQTGLVAAVTTDDGGNINFPYEYARRWSLDTHETRKRLSFCCTLLSLAFLRAFDFRNLDPSKNWYDVFISHKACELGFRNLLMLDNPVVHRPHSSRPWKLLKYTNPLKYYWLKLIHGRDRI